METCQVNKCVLHGGFRLLLRSNPPTPLQIEFSIGRPEPDYTTGYAGELLPNRRWST